MDYSEWISSLQVGQIVAVHREYGTGCPYVLSKVDRRIPNKDVVIDQIIFDSKTGKGKAGFEHYSIHDPTKDVQDIIETYKLRMLIKSWANDASLKDLKSAWTFITTP